MDRIEQASLGRWSTKRPMRIARSHFGSAVFQGRIYVFGGGGEGFRSLNQVEIYDPPADQWTEGREMPTTRSGAVAVTLNGRIYVMGGGFREADGTFRFLRTVEIYDPLENLWESGPDLLQSHDAPAATLLDGRIFLLGGHHPEAKGGPLSDPAFPVCEQFNERSGRWQEIPPMPTPRFSLVALSWGGKVLAMGGGAFTGREFTNHDRVEEYDPDKRSWSDSRLTLPWRAAGPGAALFGGGILLCGGNNGKAIQRRAALYDPIDERWTELAVMPEARAVMAALSIGETLYIVGGRDATGKAPVNTVFAFEEGKIRSNDTAL